MIVLGGIKKLAQQTVWYGASTIVNRMLGYLLTPLLTSIFAASDFGVITTLFSIAAFMNIFYSFGMETAYFRFVSTEKEGKVFNVTFLIISFSTLIFSVLILLFSQTVANFIKLPDHPEYIGWIILIVALDTLAVLPFSRLRYSGRPIKFAFVKILGVLIQLLLVVFFFFFCKNAQEGSLLSGIYRPEIGVGYVILANVVASGITLLLLSRELLGFRLGIDRNLFKQIIIYSLPLLIVGFGGMVNDLIDRFVILNIYPGTVHEKYTQSGIYSANYKLAIIIALFIQAFRLGAEPFFFKQSTNKNAPFVYARVMKFFVITCCCCFLLVVLFLDFWKYFMGKSHPEYWTGLKVVPILLMAKIFLGIYYNLSVWYKITNRNQTGAWITLGGVAVTLILNFLLVPFMGYTGCAIATLVCYATMMISSYLLGQKHFPVPYDLNRIFSYIVIAIFIFVLDFFIIQTTDWMPLRLLISFCFGVLFLFIIIRIEKDEFKQLPYFSRFIR